MSCPIKYRQLGDFPDYYAKVRTAPYLTIFIGGNHEASSHLWELYYGGWVCPNIYYMGAANILRIGSIRIAGLSGIWKGFDYQKTHHERLPFQPNDVKTFYHVREFDVRKLLQVQSQVDVGLSHDWPRKIEDHGDAEWLFRRKPDFRSESRDGTLGSVAAKYVMDRLRPPYWFSAHMHIKFAALVKYNDESSSSSPPIAQQAPSTNIAAVEETNPDEIDLDEEDAEPAASIVETKLPSQSRVEKGSNGVSEELRAQLPASFKPPTLESRHTPGQRVPEHIRNKEVRFLALDKCLPGRHFLQLCEIQPIQPTKGHSPTSATKGDQLRLQYDPEWLAITRCFHRHLDVGNPNVQAPPDLGEDIYKGMIEKERAWVEENIVSKGKLDIPYNFEETAPAHEHGTPQIVEEQPDEYTNPQTATFCHLLEIENKWDASVSEREQRKLQALSGSELMARGPRRGGGGGGGHRGRGWNRGRGGRGRGRGR